MKHLIYIVPLMLIGCANQKSDLPPNPATASVKYNVAMTSAEIPPAPTPLLEMDGPPLPCTNCYVVLQESSDLKTWNNHDEQVYYVVLDSTNHYAEAGPFDKAVMFYRYAQTNL